MSNEKVVTVTADTKDLIGMSSAAAEAILSNFRVQIDLTPKGDVATLDMVNTGHSNFDQTQWERLAAQGASIYLSSVELLALHDASGYLSSLIEQNRESPADLISAHQGMHMLIDKVSAAKLAKRRRDEAGGKMRVPLRYVPGLGASIYLSAVEQIALHDASRYLSSLIEQNREPPTDLILIDARDGMQSLIDKVSAAKLAKRRRDEAGA